MRATSEEEIFAHLGLEYIPPSERNAWADLMSSYRRTIVTQTGGLRWLQLLVCLLQVPFRQESKIQEKWATNPLIWRFCQMLKHYRTQLFPRVSLCCCAEEIMSKVLPYEDSNVQFVLGLIQSDVDSAVGSFWRFSSVVLLNHGRRFYYFSPQSYQWG